MDELIIVLICVAFVLTAYLVMTYKPKHEKEYERKLQESLQNEFIIDPETGAKLTLEQAESGHWVAHDNEFLTLPETDIEKLYTEEEKEAKRAINYLKKSRDYLKYNLTDSEYGTLETTKLLSQYDDWSYSHPYKIQYCDGIILLPAVEMKRLGYHESQVLFWVRLHADFGHYYFREKSSVEKFFDAIRNDDELQLQDYECFTFEKSQQLLVLVRLLKQFEGQKGLEFEFMKDSLFIKSTKLVNRRDMQQIEMLVRKVGEWLN